MQTSDRLSTSHLDNSESPSQSEIENHFARDVASVMVGICPCAVMCCCVDSDVLAKFLDRPYLYSATNLVDSCSWQHSLVESATYCPIVDIAAAFDEDVVCVCRTVTEFADERVVQSEVC